MSEVIEVCIRVFHALNLDYFWFLDVLPEEGRPRPRQNRLVVVMTVVLSNQDRVVGFVVEDVDGTHSGDTRVNVLIGASQGQFSLDCELVGDVGGLADLDCVSHSHYVYLEVV